MIRFDALRREYNGRAVLETGISIEQFRSRAKEFPLGSEYVAALGTVFGPKFTYGADEGRRPPKDGETAS